MDDERRVAKRYVLWIPLQLEAGSDTRMLAVSRNISWSGALMIAGADMAVGEKVKLRLQIPGTTVDRTLSGEIVRTEANEEDPDGLWRYRIAVKFDEDVPELEANFEALQNKTRSSRPPGS
jgi:hypothetical protein